MGKLVRDKIPDIIRASGRTAEVRQLDREAYLAALYDKLGEEAAELRGANTADKVVEEAADVLEVLIGLAALHGHTLDDILRVAFAKRTERGGFGERLWLERP
jgi:predicted house-cleaning noncanonical NTP pyrophosphatase (MazG superfamily)